MYINLILVILIICIICSYIIEIGSSKCKYISNDVKYIGMKLDTWKKVILLYIMAFLTSIFNRYYNYVIEQKFHLEVWNPACQKPMNIPRSFAYFIMTFEPFCYFFIDLFNFFLYYTMQLQFILPKILSDVCMQIPYFIYTVSLKKYIK